MAPRYAVRAPVKTWPAGTPEPAPGGATIEYATNQELEADFIENLSHGGAFVRSATPPPVGTQLSLHFRLPNGSELIALAVVAFVNASGMGVRFTLDAEGEAALQAAIAHLSARPRRAVVVDDDGPMRRMLADALTERGFEVQTACDADDGMRILSEELLGLDLLLTDVFMPGMGGGQFVRTIRDAGGETDLAIVVVTGKMDLATEQAARGGRGRRRARQGARAGPDGAGGRRRAGAQAGCQAGGVAGAAASRRIPRRRYGVQARPAREQNTLVTVEVVLTRARPSSMVTATVTGRDGLLSVAPQPVGRTVFWAPPLIAAPP